MSGARFATRGHALNHDVLGQLLGNPEARVADLANDVRRMADEPDVLVFAQAHLAQAIADIGRGGEFLDANCAARLHMAEWTSVRMGALALNEHDFWFSVFWSHWRQS